MPKINLGDKVKDPVTGVTGIAFCSITYLQGCNRIGIQEPIIREKGKASIVPDLYHVDEPQLIVLAKSKLKKNTTKKNGGPSYRSKMAVHHAKGKNTQKVSNDSR